MTRKMNLLVAVLIAAAVLQCSNNPTATDRVVSRELTASEKLLVESDNEFGLKLFKEIVNEEQDENIFISPLSVSMALGMTYNGAAGTTREAMQKTLELSGLSIEEVNKSYKSLLELLSRLDPKVRFQIANSIWYRKGMSFEKDFIELNKTYFDALVSELDFADPKAAETINGWVDENTNGKITQIVDPPIDPLMVMFLINAIYFKGAWTHEFDKELTRDADFFLPDESRKPCKLMTREGEFRYFENSDFQAVDLPYGDGDFSMIVFLPRRSTDIDSLIAEFSQENWNGWISSFSERKGILALPRFTLKYELKLNHVLNTLGMGIAFRPFEADFGNMCKTRKDLYISEVKHKTFVEVNEEGTEAAAVTSVGVAVTSVDPTLFWMRVDRPFIFAIRENKSQTLLFMGKIVEPTLE
jgi:serine protease inhibitor